MRSVTALTCGAAFLLAIALGAMSYVAFDQADARLRRLEVSSIGTQFEAALADTAHMVTAQAETIANLPTVQAATAQHDRLDLMKRLDSSFETLRRQFGIDFEEFADAQNAVVLRLHNPDQFGDDISATRPMVVEANAKGTPQSGLEIGPLGLRMRGVAAINYQGQRVGTVEVGTKIDRMLETMRRATNAEFTLLIDPKAESIVVRPPGTPPLRRFGNLLGDSSTDWELMEDVGASLHFEQVKEPFYRRIDLGERSVDVLVLAMLDYSGKPLGDFVSIMPLDDDAGLRRTFLVQIMTIAAVGAIALICLILVVFRGLVLRPVEAAAASAEALAAGKLPPELPPRGGKDAVGRLFAALERLRTDAARAADGAKR